MSDDMISREAALDVVAFECGEWIGLAREISKQLRQLPAAQPEIIRCKDCRYAVMTYTGECKYCTYLAYKFGIDDAVYFDGDDYCSHAERRTDE